MKALLTAAAVAAALSVGAVSAQAENVTDRAMGAGSYIHPNGSSNGVWAGSASHAGAVVTGKSARAQNETDRAVGAGSYLHPTGPSNGVWR